MNADDDSPVKKKLEKPSTDNLSVDKSDAKRTEKGDEEPKPRIVLTFRSEKSHAKSSNMKIVPTEEKSEEAPRRSSRTRGKWEWICDSDTSPKMDKSGTQTTSENDESDSSHTTPKRSSRSKDSDNVLANAIARKEKSYETQAAPQRLSRRIKPTAKILANEELRIGLESQNNARLGIQVDKSPEEGVRTRRSARPAATEEKKPVIPIEEEVVEIATTDDDSQSQNTVMKLKHLCELGLKARSPEDVIENRAEVENNLVEENELEEMEDDEDDEIDDDPNVISKLLETDEESDEDFHCSIDRKKNKSRQRRSTRHTSSHGMNDGEVCSPTIDDELKSTRRSSKRLSKSKIRVNYCDMLEWMPKPKRIRSSGAEEVHSDAEMEETLLPRRSSVRKLPRVKYFRDDGTEWYPSHCPITSRSNAEMDDNSNPAGGEDGSEATCPVDESTIIATCYCQSPSNVYAAPEELTEPVFCQAVELVDGVRVGCSHVARRERATGAAPGGARPGGAGRAGPGGAGRAGPGGAGRAGPGGAGRAGPGGARPGGAGRAGPGRAVPGRAAAGGTELACMVRAGPRAPYFLACALHAAQLDKHMCCPACGLFCTQGTFYQCSSGHLFHLDCGLPYNDVKGRPGCPHCGVYSYRWQPANTECVKVKVEMKCSNKRIFLPDQREQCTPAYLTFGAPDFKIDQGPIIPEDLLPSPPIELKLLGKPASKSPTQLCEAIIRGDSVDQLLPKLVSSGHINRALSSQAGGTCAHAAAGAGRAAALYLLHYAGANLDATDNNRRTPLIRAINSMPVVKENTKEGEEIQVDGDKESQTSEKAEKDDEKSEKAEVTLIEPTEEDIIKVIRYLLAAGCDVNFPGPEGMTALHNCVALGGVRRGALVRVARLLLSRSDTLVDARDAGGWTPLMWAAEKDYPELVTVLLEAGADPLATDHEGNGAVHWCALAGAAPALCALLQWEPRAAHALNANTDTPLHVAAHQGHYACVVILLARGARTDIENSTGELPVEVCSAQCQTVISLNMQMSIVVKDKLSRFALLSSDISNGREPFPIPCVNEVDDAPLPDNFTYVTRHVMPHPISVDNTIDTLQGCECKDGECSSGECACCALSVRCWYTRGRLQANFPYHDPPMLFECNQTCGCNLRRCNNSVVSRATLAGSLCVRAQVFRVEGARGWGLRARQPVPRGSCAALYCGELLAMPHADTRPSDYYMFDLDVKDDLQELCSEKTQLCVDASQFGSAARFMNHSCRPNLAPVPVLTQSRDLRLPNIALFATRDIAVDEEFTFDYGEKFWSVKSKWMKCECGHAECRYPVKSTDRTESS